MCVLHVTISGLYTPHSTGYVLQWEVGCHSDVTLECPKDVKLECLRM